jgi:hypothetical protein
MAFKMAFNKQELSGPPPLPNDWYDVRFLSFDPKKVGGKDGKEYSVNLNANLEVIGQEHNGRPRKVFVSLNSNAGWTYPDFCHCFGLPLEVVQDGNEGTEAENLTIPGVFVGADQFPEEPEKWKYQGPLTNATGRVELGTTEYQGRQRNEVRQFKCAIPDCKERHATNLLKGK